MLDNEIPKKSAVTEGMGLNVFEKIATAARITTMKNKSTQAIGYVFSSGAVIASVDCCDVELMV